MLLHLLIVHGCLYTTAEALSSYSRDPIIHSQKYYYLALYRQTFLTWCDLSCFSFFLEINFPYFFL